MASRLPPKAYIPVTHTQVANLICSNCFHGSQDTVRLCSKCKRVGYCNVACQNQDWKEHKPLCQQFQNINNYDRDQDYLSHLEPRLRLEHYLQEEEIRWRIFTETSDDHPYGRFPGQLISFGKKCQVCFRTPFHDKERTFTACKNCRLAWWCSSECDAHFSETHTKKECAEFRIVAAFEAVGIAYALARPPGQALVIRTEEPRTSYLPPSSLSGWTDYDRLFPEFSFAVDCTALEFKSAHPDAVQAVKLLATNSASMLMTVFRALEDVLPDLPTRSTLCIHIVAADGRELGSKAIMEELLHYLPRLKSVTLVYVGPEVDGAHSAPNLACSQCQGMGRNRATIRHRATYHEFAHSSEYSAHPPDLVVGFNTGMGEIDVTGWRASLGVMLASATPAVFTSYTAIEASLDAALLRRMGALFLKDPQKNIWSASPASIQEKYRQPEAEHRSSNCRFIIRGRAPAADNLE
ncbi:hypothetical protein FB451DRAFT_1559085 [Mycena latifolia]|nr:hypothetical protein FB451DRAFT_1559085 [Mycena latifolia]